MTPSALRLLLDEQGDRVARANGEATASTGGEQYGSPTEFDALAALQT